MPAVLKQSVELRAVENAVPILAVTPFDEDYTYLTHSFHHTCWRIDRAANWAEARNALSRGPYAVLLCEHQVPDASWRDVLEYVRCSSDPPVFILASRTADDPLWAEVLNLGGYDVLVKPFDRREVIRVVGQAGRHWNHRAKTAARAAACSAVT